jgi:hypothetical protein
MEGNPCITVSTGLSICQPVLMVQATGRRKRYQCLVVARFS